MRRLQAIVSIAGYALLMLAFWTLATHSRISLSLGESFPRAFASFALLFAALWFFGFGVEQLLLRRGVLLRILIAASLGLPYFVFAAGTPLFYWRAAVVVVAFPVLLAAFLGLPKLSERMTLRDCAALAVIVAAYYLHWLQIAWPLPQLSLFPKLFLADVALYCFLVIRKLDGTGFSLIPSLRSLTIGLREWLFYFPIALVIGELTGFIHFHRAVPSASTVVGSLVLTFFLIALPEELFFRSILQNLIETRLGRNAALVIAAVLFGLSHFNHGSVFNWRYVLLAAIAGIFYGRAWRANRRAFASIVTHTAVDVVWSLWFR